MVQVPGLHDMIHVYQSHGARDDCAVDDWRHGEVQFLPIYMNGVNSREKKARSSMRYYLPEESQFKSRQPNRRDKDNTDMIEDRHVEIPRR